MQKSWLSMMFYSPHTGWSRNNSLPSRKRGIVKEESGTDDLKSGPIALVKWYIIVLDEAHVIRNRTSQVAGACWKLEAEKRWFITRTPMQNGIDDLYSYLRFLRYEPYTRYSSFRSLLKEHNSADASVGRNKLQIFLGIILLRHTKGETNILTSMSTYFWLWPP
jgi:hypothetical protein